MNKKVLFCHGLGGNGLIDHKDVMEYFANRGIDIVSPTIDHQSYIRNPLIFNYFKKISEDCEYIVGNSMGGFFAYHIGKALGKPTLVFNPALSSVTTSYIWFNSSTKYLPASNQKDTLILLSTNDDVVDHRRTKEFLEQETVNQGYTTNRVEPLVDMTHNLDFMIIVNEILDFTGTEREEV